MALATASQAILEQLAAEHRRILSGWRALVLLRRATFELPSFERRWSQLPDQESDLYPLFRQMKQRGEIEPIRGMNHLYQVTVPYARRGPVDEEEILLEIHPYAAISHLSALSFHALTDNLPKRITTLVSLDGKGDLLPLNTEPRDWEGIELVSGRKPRHILKQPIIWSKIKPERFFGLGTYQPRGYLVRVTTPERTLLDGLLAPELSGGIENVLRAWMLARDTLNLDVLTQYVDRIDIAVLRQRVGFILDELHLSHLRVEHWQGKVQRGGSSKLVASRPYAPHYSERWSISLNAPIHSLHDNGHS